MENTAANAAPRFKEGLKDGIPIALGYLPVAFAFGVAATKARFLLWLTELMGALFYTGSGQFAILNLIQGGETVLFTYALTIFVVNCRYILLSLSFSQRIDPNMSTLQRMLFAFFNTDELFAVAIQQRGKIKASYLFGIALFPYVSWLVGTVIGCLFTNIMPMSVSVAMGIVPFAMYIATIIPPARRSRPIFWVIVMSVILSIVLECTPFIRGILSAGWIIIICAVVASVIGAIMFPIDEEEDDK